MKQCSIEDASAVFVARMRQVTGSERMWLRFRLLEQGSARLPRRSRRPGWGAGASPSPAWAAFAYRQAVRGLEVGLAVPRPGRLPLVRRRRRTLLADGAPALAGPCRQFDVLPNLTATPVGAKPLVQEGVVRYRVLVTNEGIATGDRGAASRLTVDGAVIDTVTVARAGAGRASRAHDHRARPARAR